MSTNLRDHLHVGLGRFLKNALDHPALNAERLYQKAIGLKDGEEGNLREAFLMFKEASESNHKEATKELAECYLHGRGCERDLVKAAQLGNPKAALELGRKMERNEKESECVRYLWMASDLGEIEATIRLAEIYQIGEMVDKDERESKRLFRIVVEGGNYQEADGVQWGVDQEMKILYIGGEGIWNGEREIPWEDYKNSIKSVVIFEGIEVIGERAFEGLSELQRIAFLQVLV